MTLRRAGACIALMTALVSAVIAQQAGQQDKQFQAALQKEMVASDLKGAIEEYRRISTRPGVSRALAAEALLRMAECYEKLEDQEARKIYERIVAEFPAERAIADRARQKLNALRPSGTQPFAAVPADTRVRNGWVPSPNGQLAAAGDVEGLVLVDLRAGTHRVLVRNTPPQGRAVARIWSPDGTRIAFLWHVQNADSSHAELRFVDIRTGVVHAVATVSALRPVRNQPGVSLGDLSLLRWSTRDEIICAIGQGEILVFAPTPGSTPAKITLPESTQVADVLPDGSALILLGSERLIRFDRSTGREQILTRGFPVQQPRVSPDARLIVYLSSQTGTWTMRVAPLTQSEITHSIEMAELPVGRNRATRWSIDGRLTTEAAVATDNVYGMRLDNDRRDRRLERFVHNSSFASVPLISSDDRQIVYFGTGGLNVMNADGTGERPTGAAGVPLAWLSPDELVFWPRENEQTLAVRNFRTGEVRSTGHELPPNVAAASIALSSDSFQYIGFRNEVVIRRFVGDRAMFFVRRPGREERPLMDLPRVSEWRISPPGDRIAYHLLGESTGQLRGIHLRTIGGDDDKVIGSGDAFRWTADGRQLVYRSESEKGMEFRRYDVASGETATVLDARHVDGVFPPESTWHISHCSLATDQSFLVCQAVVTTAQRLAWEGVTYDAVLAKLGAR